MTNPDRKREAELGWDPKRAWQIGCLQSIADERNAQDLKWGQQDHADLYWLAILSEEVGELAKCIIDRPDKGHPDFLRNKELIQVAAVCVAWMEALARRGDGARIWSIPDGDPVPRITDRTEVKEALECVEMRVQCRYKARSLMSKCDCDQVLAAALREACGEAA